MSEHSEEGLGHDEDSEPNQNSCMILPQKMDKEAVTKEYKTSEQNQSTLSFLDGGMGRNGSFYAVSIDSTKVARAQEKLQRDLNDESLTSNGLRRSLQECQDLLASGGADADAIDPDRMLEKIRSLEVLEKAAMRKAIVHSLTTLGNHPFQELEEVCANKKLATPESSDLVDKAKKHRDKKQSYWDLTYSLFLLLLHFTYMAQEPISRISLLQSNVRSFVEDTSPACEDSPYDCIDLPDVHTWDAMAIWTNQSVIQPVYGDYGGEPGIILQYLSLGEEIMVFTRRAFEHEGCKCN